MADLGYLESEIKSLPEAIRPTMLRLFRAFVKDIRFGHPNGETTDPELNMAGAFLHATTPTVPGTEFSMPHKFGRTPYLALPVLRLDTVGVSLVSLTVSRAADDKRIYLTSTVGSAPICLAVEG